MEERTSKTDAMFARCLYPDACLGGSKTLNNGSCTTLLGFLNESRLCQTCASGYARTRKFSCVSCENSDGSDNSALLVFAIVAIVLFFFGLLVLRIRSFRSFDAERRRKALHSTIKRIALSHLQMIGIVLGLSVNWPGLLENVLATVSSIVNFADGVNNAKCFYQNTDPSDFYNGVLVVAAVGPLVFVGIMAVYFLVLVHLPCTKGKLKCGANIKRGVFCPKTQAPPPQEITSLYTASFTADQEWHYISNERSNISVGPISVVDLSRFYITGEVTEDTLVWHENIKENIENEMWVPVHKVNGLNNYLTLTAEVIKQRRGTSTTTTERIKYMDTDVFISSAVLLWYLALPSLLFVGSSTLKCYQVGRNWYVFINLEKECFIDDHLWYSVLVACPMIFVYGALLPGYFMLHLRQVGSARLTDPSLMLRWGMLHSGYRKKKYWWELVVLLRKYCIIGLVTFQNRGEFQLHVALGVIILALHFHDSQHPFGHRHVHSVNIILHRYEMASLLIILFMLWCGNFFSLDVCSHAPLWCGVMVVVVFGSNFFFVGLLFVIYVKYFVKRNNFQKIKSLILDRSNKSHVVCIEEESGDTHKEGGFTNPLFRVGGAFGRGPPSMKPPGRGGSGEEKKSSTGSSKTSTRTKEVEMSSMR